MKKIIFSTVLLLSSIAAALSAKEIYVPNFMENMIDRVFVEKKLEKIFFVSPKQLQKELDARKEDKPYCIVHHPKTSPFYQIIFTTLKHPNWQRVQFKEKLYSIEEFRKLIEKQNLPVECPVLFREVISVDMRELKTYLSDWVDIYLDLQGEEKTEFIEDAMLVAQSTARGKTKNGLYLLFELVVVALCNLS